MPSALRISRPPLLIAGVFLAVALAACAGQKPRPLVPAMVPISANGDYGDAANNGIGKAWGVATGGRYGITDRTGISLRGEYVADNDNYFGFFALANDTVPLAPQTVVPTDVKIFGITATVDHLLTDQLMVRGEVRWDNVRHSDNTSNGEFFSGSLDSSESDLGLKSNQVVLGAEVVYNFNKFGGE